jgi:hypothetical protein
LDFVGLNDRSSALYNWLGTLDLKFSRKLELFDDKRKYCFRRPSVSAGRSFSIFLNEHLKGKSIMLSAGLFLLTFLALDRGAAPKVKK